jgi:OOP family OmpA-OmpF porin
VALTPEKEAADSDTAARAQFDFDCWVKEQDQNWRQDHIARCRDDFWETLEELKLGSAAPLRERTHPVQKSEKSPEKIHEKKHAALPAKTAEAMEPSPEATIVTPTKAETEAYLVFFQGQDAGLTESGKRVIDEVVNQLAQEQSYEVVLHGYTDTTGTPEDDLKLSESRAQSVKQRLVDGGVRASAIKVFAFGKSDTPVKTADNVAEPANHRVEIFLNDKQ